MAKAKFERTKPHVNIGTIGHIDHGEDDADGCDSQGPARHVPGPEPAVRVRRHRQGRPRRSARITISIAHIEYQTEKRHYAHVDAPGHADYIKNMITGAAQMDGAILVVAPPDGPMAQTREHVLLARQVGVPYLLVALNKADMVDDEEILELVEMEVRELLSTYEFPGDDVPVVKVSALKALEGDAEWGKSVIELMDAVDEAVPEPERDVDKPFLMPVEDVFTITGRGTVVTGRIERGVLKVNEDVEIVGSTWVGHQDHGHRHREFRKLPTRAARAENVGLSIVASSARMSTRAGHLQAGSITRTRTSRPTSSSCPRTQAASHAVLRQLPPAVHFRTTDVTASSPARSNEMVIPATHRDVGRAHQPDRHGRGIKFRIREGGRTVGAAASPRSPSDLI